MNLNADVLEALINKTIKELKNGVHDNEMFAIHEEGDIQVQILVTKDQDEHLPEVLTVYQTAS